MKKAISLLLIIATVAGCLSGLVSCNRTQNTVTTAPKLDYSSDPIVDFNDTSVITGCGLTATTGNVKTASNGGVWNLSTPKITLSFSKTDLTSYKEISVWINNTTANTLKASFRLVSDDGSSQGEDSYGAVMYIHPGWHQYTLPFSELTQQYENLIVSAVSTVGTPLGLQSVTALTIEALSSGSGEIVLDTVYAKHQKYGTLKGQDYTNLSSAVCFYEDSYAYLYDQLRCVLKEDDDNCAVTADESTTYVPIEILAAHRGATDITASAEKVSFNYNGTSYEFTPETNIEFVGVTGGFNPGKAMTTKPVVVGNYIMVPMEKCAEIFGYQLFYDQMGLAIFSDKKNIYNSDLNFDEIYSLIKVIAFANYSGAELIDNMNELYGEEGHTRIIMNDAHFEYLKGLLKTDPTYANWFRSFEASYAKGTNNYSSSNFRYYLSDGYRLLSMSRDVMSILVSYSFLYKMTDNPDYAEKCWKTMEATTRFRDNDVTGSLSWHPEHFLDTGELMYGFSIAYDWCYDYFTTEQRSKLEAGIWELGYGAAMGFGELYAFWADPENLKQYNAEREAEGLPAYDGNKIGKSGAPYNTGTYEYYTVFNFNRNNWTNNWNGVCNGGIVTMALAFANVSAEFREASEYLLDCTLYTIPAGLKEGYAPDGGYPESPGYWSYGTTYSTIFISGIESACGTDLGLINAPGFRESFYFINSIASTAKGVWSYHDTGEGRPDMTLFMWFADAANDPNIGGIQYNAILQGTSGCSYWTLMWYNPENINTDIELPLDAAYYGIDTVTFRSDWSNDALFCGLHGGANAASHGNLDIGNFILEYGGTRFFIDLGSDEYNLKNPKYASGVLYFSNPYRYWFYRERAEGQNTLIINPAYCDTTKTAKGDSAQGKNYDQLLGADSQLLRFESGVSSALAVVDMGCAYQDAISGVRGMLVTDDRSTVIIQDEIKLRDNKNTVYWMAHVIKGGEIEISEDKKSAIITYEGKALVCTIVVPDGYTGNFEFKRMSANYLPETGLVTASGEYSRDGMQKLVAVSTDCPNTIQLAIVCRLLNDGPYNYEWTPIDQWVVE